MDKEKLFTMFMVICIFFITCICVKSSDTNALLRFKKYVRDSRSALNDWNTSKSLCEWYGISCSPQGHVLAIHLNNLSLSGSFPFFIFDELNHLQKFSVRANNFTGLLPQVIISSNICALEILDMSMNQLNGSFPNQLMAICKSMKFLNLSHNNLDIIPSNATISDSLNVLDLSYNQIGGQLPESFFYFCKNLQFLNISNNLFTEEIPASINNCNGLKELSIANNNFTGTLSLLKFHNSFAKFNFSKNRFTAFQVSECAYLQEVDASFNDLSGAVFLKACEKLKVLNLSNNKFSGQLLILFANQSFKETLKSLTVFSADHNKFMGEVPIIPSSLEILDLSSNKFQSFNKRFCSASSLQKMVVVYNELKSPVFNSIMECDKLEMLDLSINHISEVIPTDICSRLYNLQYLIVWGNKLQGNLPPTINACKELIMLDLSHNNLTGSLPKYMSNLKNLNYLSLNNNNFSGYIPSSFGDLKSLVVLDLSHNFLDGSLPSELKDCKSLLIFRANDNRLSGTLPKRVGRSEFLKEVKNNRPVLLIYPSTNAAHICRGYGQNYIVQGITIQEFQSLPVNNRCSALYFLDPPGNIEPYSATGLLFLDVSYNNITGNIPEEYSNMGHSFFVLNLAHNSLTGSIPSSIGELKGLAFLDLSNNQLQSQIPYTLSQLTFLQNFNLSYNNLSGVIPQTGQLSTFPVSSYEGNPGLCGLPLPPCSETQFSGGTIPLPLHSEENEFKEEILAGIIAGIVSCILWSIITFYYKDWEFFILKYIRKWSS